MKYVGMFLVGIVLLPVAALLWLLTWPVARLNAGLGYVLGRPYV